jgi:hypothetical protein
VGLAGLGLGGLGGLAEGKGQRETGTGEERAGSE